MKLNVKQQIIWLLMNDVSYKNQWHYLKLLSDNKLMQESLELSQLQSLVNEAKIKVSYQFLKAINFFQTSNQFHKIKRLSQQAIFIGEQTYPKLWLQIPQPPIIVFYNGNINILAKPLVSIVGTRSVTDYGRSITEQLVKKINQEQWAVVSGLALGVDRVVHDTERNDQLNSKVAIIPTGVDQYYPLQNAMVQEELAERHLILSEYLPDSGAKKHHFIMRNRLVAGLSPVTVIIEAAQESSSLITANYALQFNREVFALPGRITDNQSTGCNQLISAGATPLISVEDTIEQIRCLFENQGIISKQNQSTQQITFDSL